MASVMNLQFNPFDQRSSGKLGGAFPPSRFLPGPHNLRLQTLVFLRWLAVAGQTIAVLGVYLVLGFPLPLAPCLAVISFSAWLNIFLAIRFRSNVRLRTRYALMLLAYDIVQLAILLYLTGGLENPFSFLFLVPVTVSASTLPVSRTIWLAVLTLCLATLLAFEHLPLPWKPGEPIDIPVIYVAGIWTSLVCGIVFTGIYVWRISEEARRMSDALTAAEMVLAREQQLSALDGLAAAAAHELGTPLATIAVVAKELKRELSLDGNHAEDLDLLISQANRCREILSRLARHGPDGDRMLARVRLSAMLEEVVEPLKGGDVDIVIRKIPRGGPDPAKEPVLNRNPGVIYGLANLVDNAADFATETVTITAEWDAEHVVVTIEDDGPGFAQDVMDKLGEPYVTTRKSVGDEDLADDGGHPGMGLGFFIAKTLLERSGGWVTLANRPQPEQGALVRIVWSRRDIDVGCGRLERQEV